MKKLITSIILTLASALAFAITDAQKAEFINYISANKKDGAEFISFLNKAKVAPEVIAVANWAEAETKDFKDWLGTEEQISWKIRNASIWAVRCAVNKTFPIYSLQDAVINDYSATRDEAFKSRDIYETCKANGFTFNGIKISWQGIFTLTAKRWYDPYATLQFVPEIEVARNFDVFLKSILLAKLDAKTTYELYSKITKNFAQYKKTVKAVGDNWETLQADKNEAFMQYYAEQKLESLNK